MNFKNGVKKIQAAAYNGARTVLLLLSKFWSERVILIFVDCVSRDYKLSCCGSFGLGFFSFVWIVFGRDV